MDKRTDARTKDARTNGQKDGRTDNDGGIKTEPHSKADNPHLHMPWINCRGFELLTCMYVMGVSSDP